MKMTRCPFFIFLWIAFSGQAQLPAGFVREKILSGLNPTSMEISPDGRIFITEKNGTIRIVRDDVMLTEPLISFEVDQNNEKGLNHIAFHPDFETTGWIYLHFAVPGRRHNRVSRFTVHGDRVVPGSEKVIIDMDDMGAEVHHGGAMVFGFDGYLYISTGDGGQGWRGEEIHSTNAKILRVDEEGLAVPDNPWYHLSIGRAAMVYANGLRNPFTLTMHPLTGNIYVNDVGGAQYEEVNLIQSGRHYGWPRLEGKRVNQEVPDGYMDPLFQYSHDNDYCCIVGSDFYYPSSRKFPEVYVGRYFYSDYCTGTIRMLDVESGQDRGIFMMGGKRIIDILTTPEGDMYYLERNGIGDGSYEDNTSTSDGALWKITYTGTGIPFISSQPKSILAATGESVQFEVAASGALPLNYTWFVNNMEITDDHEHIYHIEEATLDMDSTWIVARISNTFGTIFSDTAILRVTNNQRPQPSILEPGQNTFYSAGDTLRFAGMASDTEEGFLSESFLDWKIDFHHGTHVHPAMPWVSGVDRGQWIVPAFGETSTDVWYRITLKARDSDGLSKTVFRDIYPATGGFWIQTIPPDLGVKLDGAIMNAPFFVESVQGIERILTAPQKQVRGDKIYFFHQWENGSALPNRTIHSEVNEQLFLCEFSEMLLPKGTGLTASYFDNIQWSGEPVVTRIDSVINFQFLDYPPHPLLPADHFSIQWDGYIQAYQSGEYTFTLFADDGIELIINDHLVINQLVAGVNFETGKIFLEGGRLYPIRLRMFDDVYSSKIVLRWSSPDFDEEVVPSSHLFPVDYISGKIASGYTGIATLTSEKLTLQTESFEDKPLHFSILSVTGQVVQEFSEVLPVGKNILSFDISMLPAGLYFLTGIHRFDGYMEPLKFVKPR
jgi:glucose/arabinose dehydrogenase